MPTSPRARLLVAGTLLVLVALPTAAAADAPDQPLPKAAEAAYLGLAADVLEHEPPAGAAPEPVDHLRDHVLNASAVPTNETLAAWRSARDANASQRAALHRAEAALLDLADRNVEAAYDDGNRSRAAAWVAVVTGRAWANPRGQPAVGSAPAPEPAREAVHGALAARARELAVQGVLLNRTGHEDVAAVKAQAASRVVDVLEPDGVERLPPNLKRPLRENATGANLTSGVRSAPEAGAKHVLTGVVAPLTSLEVDHRVEPLEEWAARNVDAAVTVARAAREDPGLLVPLMEGAWKQYRADRGRMGLTGEGTIDGADQAYMDLRNASAADNASRQPDAGALYRGATDVARELRDLALMRPGLVVDVTSGGVRPNRTHRYDVALVKPPLEGLSRIEALTIRWDPAIVETTGAEAGVPDLELTARTDRDEGVAWIAVNGTFDPPRNTSARAVKLLIEARGAPETTSPLNVTEARFAEPDGDEIDTYIVRDGQATVANITTSEDEPVEDEPPRPRGGDGGAGVEAPLGVRWAAGALVGAALLGRWRRGS